ncbi:hypothetical protein [Psychrobacter sp.]
MGNVKGNTVTLGVDSLEHKAVGQESLAPQTDPCRQIRTHKLGRF